LFAIAGAVSAMCESSAAIAADLLASDAGTPAPCLARSSALALAILAVENADASLDALPFVR
jgi:hypothetical protein